MAFSRITHCVFDLDGTIFDTETVYYRSINMVLRQFGKQHSIDLCRKIIGRTRQDYSKIIVEEMNLSVEPKEFLRRMDILAHQMFVDCHLLPGADRLLRHLYNHKIPIAIATSSNMESVDLKFTKYPELKALFSHIVSGTDDPEVLNGKPDPDIFLLAAKRFSPAPLPEQCLVFEDSPNGVKAGLSAGMQVVMIPDPKIVTDDQMKEPTICVKTLNDFKPELFGLPPYPTDSGPIPYELVFRRALNQYFPRRKNGGTTPVEV